MVTESDGIFTLIIDGTPATYTIAAWQIERDGLEWWLNHLEEKRWFDDKMRTDFILAWYDYEKTNL
jgi:hypothetical protein